MAIEKRNTPPQPLSIAIETQGFTANEILRIEAPTPREASQTLGKDMKSFAQSKLSEMRGKVGDPSDALLQSEDFLESVEKLAKRDIGTIDGVNYLERYLESLKGFADGVGIAPKEAAFIQIEEPVGCQTLMLQDRKTNRIVVVHTEENSGDQQIVALHRQEEGQYRYRLVEMTIGGKTMEFFAYPGLCTGGPAMGVNKETGCFVSVDALYTATHERENALWINAVASMLLDIGDIEKVRMLVERLQKEDVGFYGGYAIHMAQMGKPGKPPQMTSFEFGARIVREVPPRELPDRLTVGQSNYPRTPELLDHDELKPPGEGESWKDKWTAVVSFQVQRRNHRLGLLAALMRLGYAHPRAILKNLRLGAPDPWSDVRPGVGENYTTGLSSPWVAAHAVAVISQEKNRDSMEVIVGKLTPRIEGEANRTILRPDESNPARNLENLARNKAPIPEE